VVEDASGVQRPALASAQGMNLEIYHYYSCTRPCNECRRVEKREENLAYRCGVRLKEVGGGKRVQIHHVSTPTQRGQWTT
jgi:hypothetical protein